MDPIIIIGAGLSGYNLVREFRKLDTSSPIYMISADEGNYYSKPQLLCALTNGKDINDLQMIKVDKMREQLQIDILTNTKVVKIAPSQKQVTLDNQDTLTYSKLIIAWGTTVLKHNITGSGLQALLSINNLNDYKNFRAALNNKNNVAIIGAGLIGCELANDLANIGIKVHIISSSEGPLANILPPPVGTALADSLSKKNVEWHCNATVKEINQVKNDQIKVILNNTSIIDSNLAISAIGTTANTAIAKSAGIKTNKGIIVNNHLETSIQDIYAIGDCAEVCGHIYQHILPLNFQVKALAKTLAGEASSVQYPAMPISIKTPACPIIVSPPPANSIGNWIIQKAGMHIKATFIDQHNNMTGFALTGDRLKERLQLITLLPPPLLNQKTA